MSTSGDLQMRGKAGGRPKFASLLPGLMRLNTRCKLKRNLNKC